MAIPEAQLETWSHQGSVKQSAATYQTIRGALESDAVPYMNRNFEVFLQGSYGNDTNVYAESDVDVVILYEGSFFKDTSALPPDQLAAYKAYFSDGKYPYAEFKSHVQTALENAFRGAVSFGSKAFKVAANGAHRSADVVTAFEYRRYHKFISGADQHYTTGMAFYTTDNQQIVNYPKLHSKNLTAKHQATGSRFKSAIRIFKNLRRMLVDKHVIEKNIAPSYFIEGLLYSVPNDCFAGDRSTTVFNILDWLQSKPDRSGFVCANEQYYLLRDNEPVCWPSAN